MCKIKTACIIDDDDIAIFGLKRALKKSDFCESFLVFQDGEEALEEIKNIIARNENLPEVIFLDLNMPILDGWDFLADFELMVPKQLREPIALYVLSSSIDPKDLERIKNYKIITSYIQKPFTPENLRILEKL